MRIRKHSKKFLHFLSYFLMTTGVLVIMLGLILEWRKAQNPAVTSPHPTISNGDANTPPSTEKPKPSEFDSYTVAPDLPRYLFISKLSIKAMVKPIGLTKDNRIDVPKSSFDAGWYTSSAKPGQPGALVIDGHVSGGAVPGIFYNLKDLRLNDTLTLERGDGTKFTFRIVKTQEYNVDNVDMAAALAPVSSRPGLNLITCTGNIIKGTNNYDKRLIVFTEQL